MLRVYSIRPFMIFPHVQSDRFEHRCGPQSWKHGRAPERYTY